MAVTVLAFDYDGTLTPNGRLAASMIEALGQVRRAGFAVVLVTGRIVGDLLTVCPTALELFDRIVAENGAVLRNGPSTSLVLARPVDRSLAAALAARGVPVGVGEVLIATEARFASVVEAEVARLDLDARIFLNKASLMVLPASVSKASGLSHALASLGAMPSQVVAFGDGENDRELLEAAGLGVAVGDAVEELQAVADLVLDESDGVGVERVLRELAAGADPFGGRLRQG